MTHRAEQIMAVVTTTLTGLTTTGSNVVRGRASDDEFAGNIENALSIYQGSDEPDADSWPIMDSALTVYVDLHVKKITGAIDTQLNLIREEVTKALHAVEKLGLAFVIDVEEGTAGEPEITGAGEKPAAIMRTTWVIKYSRNYNDPGN